MPVYKYLPEERSDIIKRLLIRFSPRGALNDPYECLPAMPKIDPETIIDRIGKNILSDPNLSEAEKKRQFREFKKGRKDAREVYRRDPDRLGKLYLESITFLNNRDLGILSLSKRWDSTVMWAHYSQCHRGFVIGFDERDSFFSRGPEDPTDLGTLKEVLYSAERCVTDPMSREDEPSFLLRKNTDWAYEQEMRLLRPLCNRHKFLSRPGEEYDISLFRVPPGAIESVCFGMNASEQLKNDLVSSVVANPELQHVRFFQARLSFRTFAMDRDGVDLSDFLQG